MASRSRTLPPCAMINGVGAQEGRMKPFVRKSGAACSAEIAYDLAQDIDEATFGEIERAFHDNIVVVFRRQTLSNERHIEFSRRFGELEVHIVEKYLLPG